MVRHHLQLLTNREMQHYLDFMSGQWLPTGMVHRAFCPLPDLQYGTTLHDPKI